MGPFALITFLSKNLCSDLFFTKLLVQEQGPGVLKVSEGDEMKDGSL